MEIWMEIEEAPRYLISCYGRVVNRMTDRFLRHWVTDRGYLWTTLYTNHGRIHRPIHRLVLLAFLDCDHAGLEPNHIDGDKWNNFIGNLEWVTHQENLRHALRTGLTKRKGGPIRIVETNEIFETLLECADAIGGTPQGVHRVLQRTRDHHKGYTFDYV